MQKPHGLFAALLLSLLALPAIAQSSKSWVLIATQQNGDKFYLNVNTATRNGAIVSFDSMQTLGSPTDLGTTAIGYQAQGNCAHNQLRYVWTTSYNAEMNIQAEQKGEFKWKTVKPGTAGYAVLRKACEKRKG